MIISKTRPLPKRDAHRFAWAGIGQFLNVAHTTKVIIELHKLEKRYHSNAEKQARQIRYCLLQASEYHKAAQSVSIATQPLLYYYCIMSLALAEILLKQDGESSLDKARGKHGHHGLTLKVDGKVEGSLEESASQLRTQPHALANGERIGTFALWHKSAREMPIGCSIETMFKNETKTTGSHCFAVSNDLEFSQIPESGITLLDCYKSIPSMTDFMANQGIAQNLVRATVNQFVDHRNETSKWAVITHPSTPDVLERMASKILFHPQSIPHINVKQINRGYYIECDSGYPSHRIISSFPNSIQIQRDFVWFCSENEYMNEFGLFYSGLHILGNYARYWPDRWMSDVEKSTPLALSALEFIFAAEERMAILSLSELSRQVFISD